MFVIRERLYAHPVVWLRNISINTLYKGDDDNDNNNNNNNNNSWGLGPSRPATFGPEDVPGPSIFILVSPDHRVRSEDLGSPTMGDDLRPTTPHVSFMSVGNGRRLRLRLSLAILCGCLCLSSLARNESCLKNPELSNRISLLLLMWCAAGVVSRSQSLRSDSQSQNH